VAASTRAGGTGVAIQAWATSADEKRLRPGEEYALYHARDVRGAQPGAYGTALARAAEWAGVGVDTVGALVEVYERRLLGADERARRRSKSAVADRVAGDGDSDGR
jgi:RNA polymerase I-specific transcription initiation factor RRN7